MYKIYINETPLFLTNKPLSELLIKKQPEILAGQYDGKVKTIFRYIDQCEKTDRFKEVWLTYPDIDKLFDDFNSLYKRMDAAGGIVINKDNDILLMLRRNIWDLPKGKIEKNEDIESAAKREVEEETGVIVEEIIAPLCVTYHTYKIKEKRILKKTYWFAMKYKQGELMPQVEEDIQEIVWLKPEEALAKNKIFENIKEVIVAFNKTNQKI